MSLEIQTSTFIGPQLPLFQGSSTAGVQQVRLCSKKKVAAGARLGVFFRVDVCFFSVED